VRHSPAAFSKKRSCAKRRAHEQDQPQLGGDKEGRWNVTSYIVEVKSGKQAHGQYLCPSRCAAHECSEARGGQIVGELKTKYGQYLYRADENERWGDWPEWNN
jgi:hypothetical protein